jgi:hypothetical protein
VNSEGACSADTMFVLVSLHHVSVMMFREETYARPSKNTAASPTFCLIGSRSCHTTNMGNMQARKSWAALIEMTATKYATSSTHLYLWVRSHHVVKRNQYASTGEQVKMRARMHAGPYRATSQRRC